LSGQTEYLHLKPGAALPAILVGAPFRTVVIAEVGVPPEWQGEVSSWLLRAGCLYVMAWGEDCSTWDEAVDTANFELYEFGDIPAGQDAMTTWHNDETLEEVMWFAKNSARHPDVAIENTLLLHISPEGRKQELLQAYTNA
jgi:hypothetical protein